MNLTQYLSNAGSKSASALAREIGVSPALVYQWRTGLRPVPTDHCAEIERVTEGAVSRRDLRPDDWQRIWPELQDTPTPQPEQVVG